MKQRPVILIVDDTRSDLFLLEGHLHDWGYTPLCAGSGAEALELFVTHAVDLVISDQEMGSLSGLDVLRRMKEANPLTPFIMLTAHEDVAKAVSAMKHGADDYIAKPYHPDEFQAKIARALHYPWGIDRTRTRQEELHILSDFADIVTASPKMKAVLKLASRVARSSTATTVLLYGESGTGKELLARAIHAISGGTNDNFVPVNCASIPANLMESELFGHVKGAFTGAERNRDGKLALARHGTLLLDEIGDMPFDLQAKLLRVLQERTYQKVGSNASEPLECRIIVATHKKLPELVDAGQFRHDLYFRINEFPLTIPPLRERKEDIPLLVNHIIEQVQREQDTSVSGVSSEALECLFAHDWPGNVRELQHCLKQAMLKLDNGPIRPLHLALPHSCREPRPVSEQADGLWRDGQTVRLVLTFEPAQFSLDAVTARLLEAALKACDGNKSQAAKLLGINRKRFY